MRTALCPGSYDPVTFGHLDVFRRAAAIYDKIIICVTENSGKSCLFNPAERAELIRRVIGDIPAEVEIVDGFISEFARDRGAQAIVKGLRTGSDFEMEFTMAVYNRRLAPEVETVYLPAREEYIYLSSSAVRELAWFGADLSPYVPREIIPDIDLKIKQRRGR
ncbi:MAG: pantetheine-phosphate adenylyltransferase [Oscillospiraceae bacterium]|jgi:pantetheine-phosphate adenylyltransferase